MTLDKQKYIQLIGGNMHKSAFISVFLVARKKQDFSMITHDESER